MSNLVFADRREAGRVLAGLLGDLRGRGDVVVLGLPRGGVPVAAEVAAALGAPLEVFVVRKLGAPGRPELAVGAIASGGVLVTNDEIISGLGVAPEQVRRTAEREERELRRRELAYRGDRPMLDLAGRTVVVVDDGLATGASMRAALRAVRRLGPGRVVVAVPTAPVTADLSGEADELVRATTPEPFLAVGHSYRDFRQTTDEEVRALLAWAAATPPDEVLFGTVGGARVVLLGAEGAGFHATRAHITRRLVECLGFDAVLVAGGPTGDLPAWLDSHNGRVVDEGGRVGFHDLGAVGDAERVDPAAAARAADAVQAVCDRIAARLGRPARVVVWVPSAHLGYIGVAGGLGWAMRERFGADCLVVDLRESAPEPVRTPAFPW